jgi:hypothetical protein
MEVDRKVEFNKNATIEQEEAQDRRGTFMRHFSFLYLFLKMQYLHVHFINPITNRANPTYLCNIHISTTLALHVIFIDQFCSR